MPYSGSGLEQQMSVSSEFFLIPRGSHELRADEDSARILLVEDSFEYAVLVQAALARAERGHFGVVHVERLGDAIEQLERQTYDAMLLDLSLPDSDRLATIEAAGALAHRLPVIAMTGTQDRSLVDWARESGAEDVFLKRWLDRAELPSTILGAIRRHRRFGASGADPVVCRIPSGC